MVKKILDFLYEPIKNYGIIDGFKIIIRKIVNFLDYRSKKGVNLNNKDLRNYYLHGLVLII